jgi:ATP-dependent Clp protease ATP-binding subunit ClpA
MNDQRSTTWVDHPTRSALAPPGYATAAREGASRALRRFRIAAREVLACAQAEARAADDNHVGTEHVVLGILARPECLGARALSQLGITRRVFAAQRHEEEGSSPAGRIPHTPRTNRIIALAGEFAEARGIDGVTSLHLLLGVCAESEEWQASGRGGPHHLREAAHAVGSSLGEIREAVGQLMPSAGIERLT